MDVRSNIRQISELSEKFLSEFEREKVETETLYKGYVKDLEKEIESSEVDYKDNVELIFSDAKIKALKREDVSGLEVLLSDARETFSVEELEKKKRKFGYEYDSLMNAAYEKVAHNVSPLIEKWVKDFEAYNGSEKQNFVVAIDEKKEELKYFINKRARRDRKKNKAFDKICSDNEIRIKGEIKVLEDRRADQDAFEKYSLQFPALIHEVNESGKSKIEVSIPLDRNSENCKTLRKAIHDALDGVGASYVENKDSYLLKYTFASNGKHPSEIKTLFKEKLEKSIQDTGLKLVPKVYSSYIELPGIEEKKFIPHSEGKVYYTIMETAEKFGTDTSTVGALVRSGALELYASEKDKIKIASVEKFLSDNVRVRGGFLSRKAYEARQAKRDAKKVGSDYVLLKDAAKILKLSPSRVSLMIREGKLDAIVGERLKTSTQVKKFSLDLFLQEHKKVNGRYTKRDKMLSVGISSVSSKTVSKDWMVKEGVHYISDFFDKNGGFPTLRTWDNPHFGEKQIRLYWDGIDSYINSVLKQGGYRKGSKVGTGVELRRKLESRLAVTGRNISDISKIMGLSKSAVYNDLGIVGLLTSNTVRKNYSTLKKVKEKKILDFENYFNKDTVRESVFLNGILNGLPGVRKINYLGLEGPNFGSYIKLAELYNLNPKKSVIAEKNGRAYNAMKSIVRNRRFIKGGEIFEDLDVCYGDVGTVLEDAKYSSNKFNVVNLDYTGCFNANKEATLNSLFKEEKLAKEAMLFLTLDDNKRFRRNLKTDFGSEDQYSIIKNVVSEIARVNGYNIREVVMKKYVSKSHPMLAVGFKVWRKK